MTVSIGGWFHTNPPATLPHGWHTAVFPLKGARFPLPRLPRPILFDASGTSWLRIEAALTTYPHTQTLVFPYRIRHIPARLTERTLYTALHPREDITLGGLRAPHAPAHPAGRLAAPPRAPRVPRALASAPAPDAPTRAPDAPRAHARGHAGCPVGQCGLRQPLYQYECCRPAQHLRRSNMWNVRHVFPPLTRPAGWTKIDKNATVRQNASPR